MNTANRQRLLAIRHRRIVRTVSPFALRTATALLALGLVVGSMAAQTDLYGDPLPEGTVARMGSLQLRHAGLSDFIFLPDGKTILSTDGRTLRFWDSASGKRLREVKLQNTTVECDRATLSPDGKTIVALVKKTLLFWEVDSGKQLKKLSLKKLPLRENVVFLRFAPDGKLLAVGTSDGRITLWDWRTGREHLILNHSLNFNLTYHVCFSENGVLFAAGGGIDYPLCVYESATGRELHRLRCHAGTSTFSADGKCLAVVGLQNDKGERATVLRLFDTASGKETASYPLENKEFSFNIAFAPDGKTLACLFSDQSGVLLDRATGRPLRRWFDRTTKVVYSPDSKTLLANSGPRLRLWDVKTGKERHDRPGDFDWRPCLAISPDGRLLASATYFGDDVTIWDTTTGRLVRRLPLGDGNRHMEHLSFCGDGKSLIACMQYGTVQIWNVSNGVKQRTFQLRDTKHDKPYKLFFNDLRVSEDGKRISALVQFAGEEGGNTRLACWDTKTAQLRSEHSLSRNVLYPTALVCAWSADARTAGVILDDDHLTRMEVATGAIRVRIAGTQLRKPLTASANDRLLAAAGWTGVEKRSVGYNQSMTVGIWETATGREVAVVPTGPVSDFVLTPDNRSLLWPDEHSLRIWDLTVGKERRRWSLSESAHDGVAEYCISRLLVAPDGRRVFTALADGTVLVWDLASAVRDGARPVEKRGEKEWAADWSDLVGDDARRAYAVIWRWSATPAVAVPFLRRRLKAATEADGKDISRCLADLDSDEFATREKAFETLRNLGDVAEPALRRTLRNKPSLEVRRRVELLLEDCNRQPTCGETLRNQRALEVLEHAGTAEARRLLRELANGAAEARLTCEAKAALTRISRRSP